MAHTTEQTNTLETNILETNTIDLTDTQALGKIKQKSAKLALEEAQNLKGENLLLLDVKKLSALSDYVLIVTGNSSTHCRAIAENIRVQAKKNKEKAKIKQEEDDKYWENVIAILKNVGILILVSIVCVIIGWLMVNFGCKEAVC